MFQQVRAPTEALTDAVIEKLKEHVLNPVTLGNLLQDEWQRRREAPEALAAERSAVAARMATLDSEHQRLGDVRWRRGRRRRPS